MSKPDTDETFDGAIDREGAGFIGELVPTFCELDADMVREVQQMHEADVPANKPVRYLPLPPLRWMSETELNLSCCRLLQRQVGEREAQIRELQAEIASLRAEFEGIKAKRDRWVGQTLELSGMLWASWVGRLWHEVLKSQQNVGAPAPDLPRGPQAFLSSGWHYLPCVTTGAVPPEQEGDVLNRAIRAHTKGGRWRWN